ncbi:atos homolog protein B isoform X1 [Pantherophis guttatus]|uniref:Atos homolog protein B n=1 Tax=Pantherophis guttatus TaxID=94885 RepID=A0A6P9DPN4_PANGU|nr:atos homolog protein B isoform X1 [Pantherophis guttatus]XP_034297811.1 atos homolog protein B isoform X1 [Pantherophis guttatus]XP_034297812.1 atos homolog protein B isoform X1 [Pantherophis guttatus]XP_034297813.1 atos homolog protein B isoform X1 [Pantherophis guttatus]XP_034297814.1 atos homolog protein B isoform X1 [Pantherophis guttatus]
MRHLSAEAGLPREQSTGLSQEQQQQQEDEEEEEEEEKQQQQQQPWKHHGLQMGCSPPELGSQKVYQVSIFSPRGSGSALPQQRGPRRQPIKRACPEPRWVAEGGEWDAKRGHWGTEEEAIEDGLLVDGLALGGAAQHFSHSGLRVVEHRQEVSPGQRGGQEPRAAEGRWAALPLPGRLCTTLHTRDSAPVLWGEQPAMDSRPEENGGARFPHDHDLHSPALPSPPPGQPSPEAEAPNTPPEAPSLSANGLCSAEKTPCSSSQLSGGGPASCPAKRKLLPSVEGRAASGLEEENLLPARKKRALHSPTVPASCRSTDAKGAPFWNHLLPAAKGSASGRTGTSQLKTGLHLKPRRRQLRGSPGRALVGRRPPTTSTSHALLGNFEESMLKGRFPPSGRIGGFTAEIGASGSYCPQHATLPVEVTYFDIAEHNAPSPFLGVIDLEALGKKGYSIPRTGTIQVTLFNPNKTVVKMFLVTYDFHDMPANHVTFLRHRIFLVPVGEGEASISDLAGQPKRVLCYLMHLRFHSSKSGKIYLHDNIRLLFSRKSIEMDSGIPYELKSFTELPRNPCYSPRA